MPLPENGPAVFAVGDVLVDNLCRVRRLPEPGEDGEILGYSCVSGGSAANTCAVLSRLGVHSAFCGTLGSDGKGRSLLAHMERLGIDSSCVRAVSGSTGFTFTLTCPDGERTMLSYREAASVSRPVTDKLLEAVSESALLLLSGYMLQNREQAEFVFALAEKARSCGVPVMLDTAPVIGVVDKSILERMLSLTDVLMPNLDELRALCPGLDTEECIAALLEKVPVIVLKQGRLGARLAVSEACSVPGFEELRGTDISAPAVSVEVEDTTGAGDSFNAGFIAGMLSSTDPELWLRKGNETAALVISGKLCRTLNEKDELL